MATPIGRTRRRAQTSSGTRRSASGSICTSAGSSSGTRVCLRSAPTSATSSTPASRTSTTTSGSRRSSAIFPAFAAPALFTNPASIAISPNVFGTDPLVHPTRFRPVTFGSGGQRSIQLSYGCVWRVLPARARRNKVRRGWVTMPHGDRLCPRDEVRASAPAGGRSPDEPPSNPDPGPHALSRVQAEIRYSMNHRQLARGRTSHMSIAMHYVATYFCPCAGHLIWPEDLVSAEGRARNAGEITVDAGWAGARRGVAEGVARWRAGADGADRGAPTATPARSRGRADPAAPVARRLRACRSPPIARHRGQTRVLRCAMADLRPRPWPKIEQLTRAALSALDR